MDGVELKTFCVSMCVGTLIYFGLAHYQNNPPKSIHWKIVGLIIVLVYMSLSTYYLMEVAKSAETILNA